MGVGFPFPAGLLGPGWGSPRPRGTRDNVRPAAHPEQIQPGRKYVSESPACSPASCPAAFSDFEPSFGRRRRAPPAAAPPGGVSLTLTARAAECAPSPAWSPGLGVGGGGQQIVPPASRLKPDVQSLLPLPGPLPSPFSPTPTAQKNKNCRTHGSACTHIAWLEPHSFHEYSSNAWQGSLSASPETFPPRRELGGQRWPQWFSLCRNERSAHGCFFGVRGAGLTHLCPRIGTCAGVGAARSKHWPRGRLLLRGCGTCLPSPRPQDSSLGAHTPSTAGKMNESGL